MDEYAICSNLLLELHVYLDRYVLLIAAHYKWM